jgi:hypothetical protein
MFFRRPCELASVQLHSRIQREKGHPCLMELPHNCLNLKHVHFRWCVQYCLGLFAIRHGTHPDVFLDLHLCLSKASLLIHLSLQWFILCPLPL